MLAWAVWHSACPWRWVQPGLNLFTFWSTPLTKRSAAWHVAHQGKPFAPAGLVGGWPAAWLAQQTLRHKSQKAAFRAVYAPTVVAHCGALAAWLLGLVG